MKRKKIGLIAPDFPPSLGGVQEYCFNFSKELINLGYELVLLTSQSSIEFDFSADQLFPRRELVFKQREDLETICRYDVDIWHSLDASYAWLAKYIPNFYVSIHGNDFLNPYHLTEEFNLYGIKIPLFSSRLRLHARRWLAKKTILQCLPLAQKTFANSEYTRKRLIALNKHTSANTVAIGVGVSNFFFETDLVMKKEDKCLRLVTVSRLSEPRKNIDLVLQSLVNLKLQGIDFAYTIIGDGEMRQSLQNLAEKLNLSSNVCFLGSVSKEVIRQTLSESNLFVLTSSSSKYTVEGFGIVYLEANACGIPVLAANEGGAAEAVVSGQSGFFVEQITVAAISKALLQFAQNKHSFDTVDCRAFAAQYSWKNITQKMISYYDQLS